MGLINVYLSLMRKLFFMMDVLEYFFIDDVK